MSDPLPPSRSSFEENVSTLLDELVLAEKWQRPSILLAVHKSKFGQDRAEKALEDKLKKLGQSVSHIVVDKERSDVPHLILAAPAAPSSIFFVSNIDWGGGQDRKDAYRSLNIYRELFVDHHLKVVFWLTQSEAAALPRFAPDFWAFRHRVVEFTGQRLPRRAGLPAGVLIWDIQNSVDPFDSLEARISVREELLAKLPRNAEARSARSDLLYNLGYLYWAMGNAEKALQQLKAGLDLAPEPRAGPIRSSLLNGLAILSYEAKQYEQAVNLYREAMQESPQDALLPINFSATCCALGRNQEAIALGKRAVKLNERDARVWNALGHIYAAIGKYDDGISCFSKAAELGPRIAAYPSALAICYDLVERQDETHRQLEIARRLARDTALVYVDIYEAALSGNLAKSLELARTAIGARKLSAIDLRRDPNLSLLLDSAQIEQMTV